jgi:hypothetical protein
VPSEHHGNPTGPDLGHFRCKACGVADGHDLNCPVYDCPHCGVSPDEALDFGHRPSCPNYVRDPFAGHVIFDDIEKRIRRYVYIGKHERAVIVTFIIHCHAIAAFYTTPRVKITSPEENCGKSLLGIDIMGPLLPAGSVLSVSVTPSALYRSLHDTTPAFVLDEFDNTAGRKGAVDSEVQSLLLAVLNSGYRRGASVQRTHPRTHEVVDFPVFAPAVVIGIRPELSKSFDSRTIPIDMQRPLPDEYPDVFEWNKTTAAEGEKLRDRIAEWTKTNLEAIELADPERPDGIVGRKAECWVPLLTVAEAVGGDWPARLREAAKVLGLGASSDSDTISHQLLADTRDVFGDRDRIHSADLMDKLNALEERRWHTWNDGEGIRSIDFFYRVIQRYKLHTSADMRIDGEKRKGFERAWFEDAWARFVGRFPPMAGTPDPEPETPETTVTPQGMQADFDPRQNPNGETPEPLQHKGCPDVSDNAAGDPATATSAAPETDEQDTLGVDPYGGLAGPEDRPQSRFSR